jgi:hypothetical protein
MRASELIDLQALSTAAGLNRSERRSLTYHGAVAAELVQRPGPVLAAGRARQAASDLEDDGSTRAYRKAWRELFRGPRAELFGVLLGTTQVARDLRQATPFTSLNDAARWRALEAVA